VLRILLQTLKILTIAAMAVLVGAGGLRLFALATEVTRPEDVGEVVEITIADGEPENELAARLADAGLVRSTVLFENQLRFGGGALEPGTYRLRKGMSNPQIIDRITGAAPEETPEPKRKRRAASRSRSPRGGGSSRSPRSTRTTTGRAGSTRSWTPSPPSTARSTTSWPTCRRTSPSKATCSRHLHLLGDRPDAQRRGDAEQLGLKYDQEMRNRTDQMGLTIHQVVTLASLVEKEAAVADERPVIADVYISRWEQGGSSKPTQPSSTSSAGPATGGPSYPATTSSWKAPTTCTRTTVCRRDRSRTRGWARSRGARTGQHRLHVLRGKGRRFG
jgi:UPF0755 protein